MTARDFIRYTDFDLSEAMTPDLVAEAVGARTTLILRLVRLGILEALEADTGEILLPRRAIIRLRRMQRLRRDLGVNFAGAAIILDLVERMRP